MLPDDEQLRRFWREPDETDHRSTPEEVLMDVHDKARQLSRALFWRDVREGVAMLLVLGVAIWMSLLAPGWSPWVGAGLLALSFVAVWRRLRSGRREAPSVALPAKAWLAEELDRVEGEIAMLRSVVRWYVLPIAFGATAWVVGLVMAIERPLPVRLGLGVALILACVAIFGAVGWGISRLNRLAADRHLVPYRDRLLRLRGELSA